MELISFFDASKLLLNNVRQSITTQTKHTVAHTQPWLSLFCTSCQFHFLRAQHLFIVLQRLASVACFPAHFSFEFWLVFWAIDVFCDWSGDRSFYGIAKVIYLTSCFTARNFIDSTQLPILVLVYDKFAASRIFKLPFSYSYTLRIELSERSKYCWLNFCNNYLYFAIIGLSC